MKKIAITGGICSGKSYICNLIEKLGYSVFYSDDVAMNLANTHSPLIFEITKEFGDKSYSAYNGTYDRKYIASIVFNDSEKLDKLNSIFAKYMKESFKNFCEIHSDEDLIFYESALIYEHNKQDDFDDVVVVVCDKNTIIERLKSRNHFTDEEIESRLNSQMDPALKAQKSDYVIDTSNYDVEERLNDTIYKLKNE